ncbi:MAG: GNAT family N-acetyltransferase, partial [Lysobacterales bacterium]
GWYVEAEYRRGGAGAALIEASEQWARANDCTEFASDALYDNDLGRTAHLAVGFTEVEAIRCFRKDLSPADLVEQEPGFPIGVRNG